MLQFFALHQRHCENSSNCVITRIQTNLHQQLVHFNLMTQTFACMHICTHTQTHKHTRIQRIKAFGWNTIRITINLTQQKNPLMFQPLSKTFIRRSSSVLLCPYTSRSCRDKKVVICVAELIAALVLIHGSLTFLADMFSLLDPPGGLVRLPVNYPGF